ncbi:MAG: L-seryl-tRNA(Sec) selenium transferase [Acidimicrobiales bacterium]
MSASSSTASSGLSGRPAADRPPSVDALAQRLATTSDLPHPILVEVARAAIAAGRVDEAETMARERARRLLAPVINATGVLLHTNLGRAPMAHRVEARYGNLELDLDTGQRGSRQRPVGELLATASGAETAMVVNNCASAVLLVLAALGAGSAVAVSRGELVEIGGAFRVPDVMAQSGTRLIEVGTTNRTRLADYRRAVDDGATAVLKVHQSNYRIVGFTEETTVAQLATVGVPVIVDIGSGLLDAACPWLPGPPPAWLEQEPAARQTLAAGADIVTFSGDKLFGGPQAGIIAGRADLVEACGRHPLARALRPGGLVLSALQATTLAYLRRDGRAIPFWRMAALTVDELRGRAGRLASAVPGATTVDTEATTGGGTLPTVTLPSAGIRFPGDHTVALREYDVPIIARVVEGATVLDLRTVDEADDPVVAAALAPHGDPAPEARP